MHLKSITLSLFLSVASLFASCGSSEKKTEDTTATETQGKSPKEITDMAGVTSYYECPMKCEGKKFSEPGNCPICGMELVLVEVKSDSTKTTVDTTTKM